MATSRNARGAGPKRTRRNPAASDSAQASPEADSARDVEEVDEVEGDLLDVPEELRDVDGVPNDADEEDSDVDVDVDGDEATDDELTEDEKPATKTTSKRSTARSGRSSSSPDTKSKSRARKADAEDDADSDSRSAKVKSSTAKPASDGKAKRTARSKDGDKDKKKSSAARSSNRKRSGYSSDSTPAVAKPNPRWFLPVMLGVLILGLLWLVVFYITQGAWPVEAWGNWNLVAGFAILVVGLGMSTRWR